MKVVIFGMGSIGTRHASLIQRDYNHDLIAFRAKKNKGKNSLGIDEIYSWKEVTANRPDIALITNPTYKHIDTAIACARQNIRLFIEKPIGSDDSRLDQLIDEVGRRKLPSYVAYNLRFHPVIQALKNSLEGTKIYHVSVYNSSYLPDWRPGRDHKKTYSAKSADGGGVILDLSHEFDYIEHLFGGIKRIKGDYYRASNVTVDAEDIMDAIIETERTTVNLHLDFISQHRERSIRIDCEDGSILADLITGDVSSTIKGEHHCDHYVIDHDQIYKDQWRYFFDHMNDPDMMNNLPEASELFRKIIVFKRTKQCKFY